MLSAQITTDPYHPPAPITSTAVRAPVSWRLPLLWLTASWIASLAFNSVIAIISYLIMDQWTADEVARLERILYYFAPLSYGALLMKLVGLFLLWRAASTRSQSYAAAAACVLAAIVTTVDVIAVLSHFSGGRVMPTGWYVSSRIYFLTAENGSLFFALLLCSQAVKPDRIRWVFIAGIFAGTGLQPLSRLLAVLGVPVADWNQSFEGGLTNLLRQFGLPLVQIISTVYTLWKAHPAETVDAVRPSAVVSPEAKNTTD